MVTTAPAGCIDAEDTARHSQTQSDTATKIDCKVQFLDIVVQDSSCPASIRENLLTIDTKTLPSGVTRDKLLQIQEKSVKQDTLFCSNLKRFVLDNNGDPASHLRDLRNNLDQCPVIVTNAAQDISDAATSRR